MPNQDSPSPSGSASAETLVSCTPDEVYTPHPSGPTAAERIDEPTDEAWTDEGTAVASDTGPLDLGRYRDLGLLGRGATGEVRRVWDDTLDRALALKVLRSDVASTPGAHARFDAEARMVARLEHPGIVPIHEIGRLPDGRPYYTMKEVDGKTLAELLHGVHADLRDGGGRAPRWTIRRLVEAFHRVCEAVAFAHSHQVLHRDLKPANIMLGAFGEALVLDWGLARRVGAELGAEPGVEHDGAPKGPPPPDAPAGPFRGVAGTPTHMAPEQARGERERLGPPADVYALGAILYEILSGRTPYQGPNHWSLLVQVLQGPPPSVVAAAEETGAPAVPDDLAALVARATAREPEDRYADAGALAADVEAWLNGARRRELALTFVATADALAPEVTRLRAHAATLRVEAAACAARVRTYDPVDAKRPAWALEDEAGRVDRQADLLELEHTRQLRAALTQEPTLPEAHARLATFHRDRHADAEARGDDRMAAGHLARLREHDREGRHAAYVTGDGALTLHTDPPGALVQLFVYTREDRRLVPRFVRTLGTTPLEAVPLPMGSYLLELHADGHVPVRYPVAIGRNEHWEGVAPEGGAPVPVPLPRVGALDPGDVYVPPGWFLCGGDPLAPGALPRRRIWVDALVFRRLTVSLREYVVFLDDLVARGREAEALLWAPRERSSTPGELGVVVLGRDAAGRFVPTVDTDGDAWNLDWPAFLMGYPGARAYCVWLAERTGQPWRLPWEIEWEKAARGVDGRLFPWGDFLDPTWCCMRDSHPGRATMPTVGSYPVDESPYGLRDVAGMMRNLCADAWVPEGPLVRDGRWTPQESPGGRMLVDRGGAWSFDPNRSRVAARGGVDDAWRSNFQGFRPVRPYTGD